MESIKTSFVLVFIINMPVDIWTAPLCAVYTTELAGVPLRYQLNETVPKLYIDFFEYEPGIWVIADRSCRLWLINGTQRDNSHSFVKHLNESFMFLQPLDQKLRHTLITCRTAEMYYKFGIGYRKFTRRYQMEKMLA